MYTKILLVLLSRPAKLAANSLKRLSPSLFTMVRTFPAYDMIYSTIPYYTIPYYTIL